MPTLTLGLALGFSCSSFLAAASMAAAAPSSSFSAMTVGSSGSTHSVPGDAAPWHSYHNKDLTPLLLTAAEHPGILAPTHTNLLPFQSQGWDPGVLLQAKVSRLGGTAGWGWCVTFHGLSSLDELGDGASHALGVPCQLLLQLMAWLLQDL